MWRRVFIDLDGTLAEFGAVVAIEEQYEEGFFEEARPYRNVVSGIKSYMRIFPDDEIIVKAPVLIGNEYVVNEKTRWLRANIPEITEYVFYPCGGNMCDYISGDVKPDDVLIDDYMPNIEHWPGLAIRLLNEVCDDNGWDGPVLSIFDKNFEDSLEDIIK